MRKFYLLAITLLMLGATPAMAEDFTDTITVNVNGVVTGQTATISVTPGTDGTSTFVLKNFVLKAGGQSLGVGTITLNGVATTESNGVTSYTTSQTIKIAAGDDPSITTWMSAFLPPIPVNLNAEQTGSSLYAVINIDLSSAMGQVIQVVFGDGGYQIAGSGFEDYTSYSVKTLGGSITVDEPLHWHSFASAGGDFAAAANLFSSNQHTYPSDVVRPGSAGQKSVLVVASNALGIVANGTITTGRMNAGAMVATDPNNHAELDMSKEDKDAAGDPYYTTLKGQPDSLTLWVKFRQGTANADYPYATVSAAITDGTYYQDPQEDGKTYTNVLATAKDNQIASNGYVWQRIAVPFKYVDNSVEGKAILVTISTNAGAGQGSATDSLYVDDVELIYNGALASATVKGQPVTLVDSVSDYTLPGITSLSLADVDVTPNGHAAKVSKTIEQNGNDATVTVKVTSQDLRNSRTYHFTAKGAVVGINEAKTSATDRVKAFYDLSGVRLNAEPAAGVYIKVYESGKAVKVMK